MTANKNKAPDPSDIINNQPVYDDPVDHIEPEPVEILSYQRQVEIELLRKLSTYLILISNRPKNDGGKFTSEVKGVIPKVIAVRAVLLAVAAGHNPLNYKSGADIARDLGVSRETVSKHAKDLCKHFNLPPMFFQCPKRGKPAKQAKRGKRVLRQESKHKYKRINRK
jgi:hypothetical protein